MRVLQKKIFRGPHLYSQTPMVQVQIDLEELENYPTNKIPGLTENLLQILPGLRNHGCSYGEPGGLVRRMTEGTWLGHVAEHIALELQTEAEMPVTRGKTRSVKGKSGVYNIMFQYEVEKAGLWAAYYALHLLNVLLPANLAGLNDVDILECENAEFTTTENAIRHLRDIAMNGRLGPTTRSIVEAAERRGIPAMRLDEDSLVQLGWGKYQRRIRGSITDATSQIAVDAAGDKDLTKKLLGEARVPTPRGDVAQSLEDALEIAKRIGFPLAVKPLDGNHGRGVTTNIVNVRQIEPAFLTARKHGRRIIVEKCYSGRDYRILAINARVVAVAERVPAHVIGDGNHTLGELIDIANSDPRRSNGHENVLSKIIVDDHVTTMIARHNMTMDDIPLKNQKIMLRSNANLSTGGIAIDRTDDIHPANIALMERAARAIGLDVAGIDVVTKDIALPIDHSTGGIIEVNASPGFRMHLAPSEGQPHPVGEAVISMLFPKDKPARIPVVAVTGTNGKSTTARMIARILRQSGKSVGLTSTSGIYVNDELLWEGDASGPQSAQTLLRDPRIEVAILETARGGILREGLGVDYCDVGAVLNVTADHLGLSGIETIQDMADLKSVVVESVSDNGVSVLNADDPLTLKMADYAGGRLCFFAMHRGHQMNKTLSRHIENGGMAVVREAWHGMEEIVLHYKGQRLPVIDIKHIPATHDGKAAFNVENALAAVAIACAMDVDIDTIRLALSAFRSSYDDNPGRFNIFDGHGFRVIMDYAHNPAALSAYLQMVDKMRANYRNVIGTVSIPGDRRDDDIHEMGRIAATSMDFIIFREAPDLRGRHPGSVNALLKEGALSTGFPPENIICVGPEEEATQICLNKAEAFDLVLLSPTNVSKTWQQILAFKPNAPNAYEAPDPRLKVQHAR